MTLSRPRPARRRGAAALLSLLALAAVGACSDEPLAVERHVYEVDVVGERFRIALTDPQRIAEAEALIQSGTPRNVSGRLAAGDGGFNEPYSWHMLPGSVEFVDLSMEVCDGRPQSEVESDVPYWLNTVKVYCPWAATVVRRVE
jgi:hypothetical protein